MIREYEAEMICDLAETYHVFNYRELPPSLVATLVTGLRADSRLKMTLTGMKIPLETTIQAMIYDAVSMLLSAKAGKRTPPKSLFKLLTEGTGQREYKTFRPADFLKAREEILNKIREGEQHA